MRNRFISNLCFLLLTFIPAFLWAQQGIPKYALVIGNASYTDLGALKNPHNDADDMTAALEGLGFNVEKVLDASLTQMENAVIRLKNRLSDSKNSYGFFFYAGHGVQSNGVNYLIPVGANVPSENYLRERALSVQSMLLELNDAGNELNVVVLDCCRDNPFSWTRGGTRGLSVVSFQPADSIIVYAASEGMPAADGEGRNGLFTEHLLDNIKTPGLEVSEVIRRTGAGVSLASGNQQRPAVYNQFFGLAYLGTAPDRGQRRNTPSSPVVPQQTAKTANPVQASTHNELGLKYSEEWDYARAIVEFDEAIRLDPKFAAAYNNRGFAYNNTRGYDRAIEDCSEAIRLDPGFAAAYLNRGDSYNGKNDYDKAIADYSEAIKLGSNTAFSYNKRGNAYYAKKDYRQAVADFEQALRLDPKDVYASQNLYSARQALVGWNVQPPW